MIHFVIDLFREARGHVALASGGCNLVSGFGDFSRVGNAPGGQQRLSDINKIRQIPWFELRSAPGSKSARSSEYVCFKLRNQPPKYGRLNESFLALLKGTVMGGYDVVINPQNELLRSADWFLEECKRRMPTSSAPQN